MLLTFSVRVLLSFLLILKYILQTLLLKNAFTPGWFGRLNRMKAVWRCYLEQKHPERLEIQHLTNSKDVKSRKMGTKEGIWCLLGMRCQRVGPHPQSLEILSFRCFLDIYDVCACGSNLNPKQMQTVPMPSWWLWSGKCMLDREFRMCTINVKSLKFNLKTGGFF